MLFNMETWINEEVVEPDSVYRLIADRWGAENAFTCRGAFLTDHLLTGDQEPDLRPHLAHLYSLDRLESAVDSLTPAIKAATKEADAAKRDFRETNTDLQEAQDAL